jgi:PAT family beta-lactamase induction signal transducer AmpG
MTARHPHPSVFMFLIVPFGVLGGYLSVAVAYMWSRNGFSVGQVAGLVALALVPHTWKFLWAPIADTTLGRKSWYVISSVLTAAGIFATGILPATQASVPLLSVIIFVSNVASTFLGMSVESLMAYGAPENEKGRAGGWFQAGNLGGAGIGGGLGLWLAQRLPESWMAGAVVAVLCLLCAAALWFVEEPAASHRHERILESLKFVVRDVWSVAKSRMGFLALVLCFLPIGSGAASGLWSAVAKDWSASANTVALVTGVVGGLAAAAGCIAGGWISDRMDRKAAYLGYGILQAACAVFMALAPRTELTYVVFTTLYAIMTGLTYAGFSAFVLEAMGLGAAATKYNVFASLSNTPIYYMTLVDGWAHGRWGPNGLLYAEAVCAAIGLVLFLGVLAVVPKRAPQPA